jgi:hypothetical protein
MPNSSSSWPIPSQSPVYSQSPCGICQVISSPSPIPCSSPIQMQHQDTSNMVTMPRDYLYAGGFAILIIFFIQIIINNLLYSKNNTPTKSTFNTISQV